jgi:DoxX-like family
MKKNDIIFWVTTGIIFLFQGVMPALTSQSEMAKEGTSHLGYPAYFGVMLAVFKVVGALALIIPQVPHRFKEWAYGCFVIELIAAFWSICAVDGLGGGALFPLVILGILLVSYVYYHKRNDVIAA